MIARILLIAAAIAWAATLAGMVWMMGAAQMSLDNALAMLVHLPFMLKAFAGLAILGAAIAVVGAPRGARRRAWIGVSAAAGWGVLGALYGQANARGGLISINPPYPFAIFAVGYAEALMVLLIALTGVIAGLVFLSQRPAAVPTPPAAP